MILLKVQQVSKKKKKLAKKSELATVDIETWTLHQLQVVSTILLPLMYRV